MALPNTTTPCLDQALIQIQSAAVSLKTQSAAAFLALQSGPVNSDWVFRFLDNCISYIAILDQYKTVAGLNSFATTQIPGYAGTLTTDVASTRTAIVSCVTWITTNFPKDSTNSFILSHTLNADGTRTPRSFSAVQTTGLQSAIQALIATIS